MRVYACAAEAVARLPMRPASATVLPASPEVGQRLRQRRKALRLSQREAAKLIGVTSRNYQRWEKGENGVTATHAGNVEEVLQTSIDWLKLGDQAIGQIPEGFDFATIHDGVVTMLSQVKHVPTMADRLTAIEKQLGRIEIVLERLSASVSDDETRTAIDATRAVKEAASASAGGVDQETAAAPPVRDAEDASEGSARARRAGKPGT